MSDERSEEGIESTDLFDGWCYAEMTPFSFKELGNDAWLTGCPLCGGQCFVDTTEEQEREADEFFSSNDGGDS